MSAVGLTVGRRLGFGVGDFGLNLLWNMTNIFVLFYYTDVLGLPNVVAGSIVMGAMIWDGITDPLVGYLAARTKSRYGRYRPYMLLGAIPLGISFALMFYNPKLEAAWMIAYVAASHVLFRTFYTVVSIPYSSLTAKITKDSDERGRLAVYRMLFATAAGVLVAGFTLGLGKALGEDDQSAGFFLVACVFSVLAALAIILCFFLTTEEIDGVLDEDEKLSLADIFRLLRQNTAFLTVLGVVLLGNIGSTISSKSLLYFVKYNLNAEDKIGLISGSVALMIAAGLPIWGWLSRKKGKVFVWKFAMLWSIFTYVVLLLNPYHETGVIMAILLFGALGGGAHYFCLWAILPDTVEYGEWKTGMRGESILFGLVSFCQKLSLGIAVGVLGFVLDQIGYQANEVQSAETLRGFHLLLCLAPLSCTIACTFLVIRFPFNREQHAEMVDEISARKKEARLDPY